MNRRALPFTRSRAEAEAGFRCAVGELAAKDLTAEWKIQQRGPCVRIIRYPDGSETFEVAGRVWARWKPRKAEQPRKVMNKHE